MRFAVRFVALWLVSSHAWSEDRKPILHGGFPSSLVRRAAYAEAVRFSRQASLDTSIHLYPKPLLLSAQRTVDFQHPDRPAWLLLHSIGEQGPRAHTNVSQLALVSAKDGKILLKAPQGFEELTKREICPADMDDAVMVEIHPGRFVLGLSCGAGYRWDGSACVVAIGGERPFERLFQWPAEDDRKNTESRIYFVWLGDGEPLALTVHQEYAHMPPKGDSSITQRQLLFRFDEKLQRYTAKEHPPAELRRIIDTARKQNTPIHLPTRQYGLR